MSGYNKTLDMVEEKQYKEKLEAVGLLINDVPYLPNHASLWQIPVAEDGV